MGYWQDMFGKQDLGEIIGGALTGILNNKNKNNSDNNGNTNNNNNNNNGGLLGTLGTAKVGIDDSSITKVFLWLGGIIVGTVLLIFAFKKK